METKYKADPNLVVEPKYYNNGVPVFEPTMAEFEDFYKFNKAINKYGMQSGIVKIIPPVEWLNLLEGTYTEETLRKVCIKNPIVQNMNVTAGRKGVYSSQNVEKQRKYDIFQWKELSEKANHTPPSLKGRKDAERSNSEKMELRAKGRTPHSAAAKRLLLGDFNIDVSEFTLDRCQVLENLYWKTLGYAEPMYGADMLGTVFGDASRPWNVAHLPNLLDLMEEKLPGVNDAYLYAGLWKASFSWHLEDQDLYSINYLHFGAPKQWYSIPQVQAGRFFDLMKEIFHEHYKSCPEFLRHKTFIASPQFLEKNGIQCNSVVHNQGEFIITYPYGYHAGFNYGFNLAESVNFALDDWLDIAKGAKKCECIGDAVAINHRQIYCKYKGIPYTPEESVAIQSTHPIDDSDSGSTPEVVESQSRPGRKRQRIVQKPITRQCILCPNVLPESMTKYKQFELLDTDHDSKALQVHRICALSQHPQPKVVCQNGKDMIQGLDKAIKSSKSSKCTFCHVQHSILPASYLAGASVACSMPKCRRNYHATCAISAGYTFDENFCKTHRAKESHFLDPSLSKLADKCLQIKPDSFVQFAARGPGKRYVGDIHCGVVTENNIDEHTFSVCLYPSMEEHMEIHYSDILMTDVAHLDNSRFISMETQTVILPQLPIAHESSPCGVKSEEPPHISFIPTDSALQSHSTNLVPTSSMNSDNQASESFQANATRFNSIPNVLTATNNIPAGVPAGVSYPLQGTFSGFVPVPSQDNISIGRPSLYSSNYSGEYLPPNVPGIPLNDSTNTSARLPIQISPLDAMPMMSQLSGPQYGCSPVFITPTTSFNFEMQQCRSNRDSNNFVFVNEYSEVQTQSFNPENYQFVDANYRN